MGAMSELETDEAARNQLTEIGFRLYAREERSRLQWIERWRHESVPDFSADYARAQGDSTIWLRSERLKDSTLPDVWLRAATGAPIDLNLRYSATPQIEILAEHFTDFVELMKDPTVEDLLNGAKLYARRLVLG